MMIENSLPAFKQYWETLAYKEPSAIQEKVYEPLKTGKDVVGISPTGTGKTVAYTLPTLEQVEPKAGLQVVILTPSQELSIQVGEVVQEWASQLGLNAQTIIGGANLKRQLDKLKEKPEIIVGTPGRIFEISETKKLKLHAVKTVILDEADQLLQQEQLATVRKLVNKMPGQRQMGFFSATSNELMEDLNKWFNVDPEWIDATEDDRSKGEVLHAYIETPTRKRVETLRRLTHMKDFRGLVFVNNVANLTLAFEKLTYEGISVAVLHGEKYKTERKQALQQFRDGKIKLLLTTDVGSRGLDIQGLPYVIQYDVPLTKESYIHRSGRTARMGKTGTVLTLVNERELREFKKLISSLEIKLSRVYLHGGEIVKELPVAEEQPERVEAVKAPVKVKKTIKPAAAKPKPEIVEPVFKKKKHRKKVDKNKGARRKTKNKETNQTKNEEAGT
ncbi:DEAD/DEAH box helicase [Carnobacterium sp. ISL-102]|uniref:DEAD/DEAH box helicase n=1 Tax=Carnobacterium sp. ISL-102 TaxID=2819142 RepID=UPI001BE81B65|nr:DEAD/DEAH box helicase [Carnobacterium sp. ISL-102]MBT2731126.1 DEAD/DEAH box helicase [Carnobacterium sp. ISL-102]